MDEIKVQEISRFVRTTSVSHVKTVKIIIKLKFTKIHTQRYTPVEDISGRCKKSW